MKITYILISMFTLVLSGCASLSPKDALTREVISKPEILFSEKKVSMDEIPLYDERPCYKFEKPIRTTYIEECINESTFLGWFGIEDRRYLGPYHVKWADVGIRMNYMGPRGWISCNKENHLYKIPDDKCVKSQGTALSKKKVWPQRFAEGVDEVEIITKPTLTRKQRENLLLERQREYSKAYEKYQQYYNSLFKKWEITTSAKIFCNDIKHEWMERDCRVKELSVECASLYTPFAECYEKGFIKLTQEYLKANF